MTLASEGWGFLRTREFWASVVIGGVIAGILGAILLRNLDALVKRLVSRRKQRLEQSVEMAKARVEELRGNLQFRTFEQVRVTTLLVKSAGLFAFSVASAFGAFLWVESARTVEGWSHVWRDILIFFLAGMAGILARGSLSLFVEAREVEKAIETAHLWDEIESEPAPRKQ